MTGVCLVLFCLAVIFPDLDRASNTFPFLICSLSQDKTCHSLSWRSSPFSIFDWTGSYLDQMCRAWVCVLCNGADHLPPPLRLLLPPQHPPHQAPQLLRLRPRRVSDCKDINLPGVSTECSQTAALSNQICQVSPRIDFAIAQTTICIVTTMFINMSHLILRILIVPCFQ